MSLAWFEVPQCPPKCGCPVVPIGMGARCKVYRQVLADELKRRGDTEGVDVWRELLKIGVPLDAVGALRKIRYTVALDAAKRFEAAPRDQIRTLVLAGPRGCGKTVAAAHVVWEWARGYGWNSRASGGKQWQPAVWCNASEVTAQTDFGRVDPGWLEGLERARILVIDDLGEDGTSQGLGALTNLLKSRHEARRATVITSNLPIKGTAGGPTLESRYGQSWFERLRVASIVPSLVAEKSMRGK